MRFVDLAGKEFSRWTVLKRGRTADNGQLLWLCKCACGTEKEIFGAALKNGKSKSCGCLVRDTFGSNAHVHGMRQSDEYRIWSLMRSRCENKNTHAFHLYGGRGISVCSRWLEFENFYSDMGERPSKNHSIDRYPNKNGNYEPSNCRWATWKEQQRNRCDNRIFTFNGVTASLAELCEINGCRYGTVHARIQKGADIKLAMNPGYIGYRALQ